MPYLNIQDTDIYYQDNAVQSPTTLIFLHGNSHDHTTFTHQLVDEELQKYRILALDLPGHGRSSRLKKYSIPLLTNLLCTFIKKAQAESPIIIGHSLGGHIAMHALKKISPQGMLIYGAPPLGHPLDMSGFKDCPGSEHLFSKEISQTQKQALINCFYDDPTCDPFLSKSIDMTDPSFREQLLASVSSGQYDDEISLLNSFKGLKGVLYASNDKVINYPYLAKNIDTNSLWNKKITIIDSSHNMHVQDFKHFNQILLSFLKHS